MRSSISQDDKTPSGDLRLPSERARRRIAKLAEGRTTVPMRFGSDPGDAVDLPASVVGLLADILDHMARGDAVTLSPTRMELTTQQAANLLDCSRVHLVQLLDQGVIPHRKVGSHRRVQTEDVLAYRRETEQRRAQTLDELTAYDQELGLQ